MITTFNTGDIVSITQTSTKKVFLCEVERVTSDGNVAVHLQANTAMKQVYQADKLTLVKAAPIRVQRVETFQVGERFQHFQHGLLVVEQVTRKFIPEDGWSFGLSAEQGFLSVATCRKATSEEQAAYEAEQQRLEQEKREQEEVRQKLVALAREAMEAGVEVAKSAVSGETERVTVQQDSWYSRYFLIGLEHIWYVEYRGSDATIWQMDEKHREALLCLLKKEA